MFKSGALAFSFCLLLAVYFAPSRVLGAEALMSLDGHSDDNIQRTRELGHTVTEATLAEIRDMDPALLAPYQAVIVSPDLNLPGYAALRESVADSGSLWEYVVSGGTLVVNVAGRVGDQRDIAPGGVDYISQPIHNAESFLLPMHPYLTGEYEDGTSFGGRVLTEEDFDLWFNTGHGYVDPLSLSSAAENIEFVLSYNNPTGPNGGEPTFVEYDWKDGRVIVTSLTYGWGVHGAVGDPQDNLIKYVLGPEPSSLCLLGLAGVTLTRRRRR